MPDWREATKPADNSTRLMQQEGPASQAGSIELVEKRLKHDEIQAKLAILRNLRDDARSWTQLRRWQSSRRVRRHYQHNRARRS
ncbi:MAG: hypothetical protein LKI22_03315 [Liquorilactobacillus nagelii]|uniref:hypothetical protein n=1 Tax=Liquorilactobacillus nagelii TaxID=82688 RepID=UPI002432C034|nr:hypothetical protein [Liquorilactobacillus nagelii]MCI1632967.1 hypothetical protein [Liquorilactobacillus nagelii]